jgi:hypothetical protein
MQDAPFPPCCCRPLPLQVDARAANNGMRRISGIAFGAIYEMTPRRDGALEDAYIPHEPLRAPLPALLGFALVSFGMVLTPGPNMIYLISRSIAQGSVAGMVSLGGMALGFVFYMLCLAFRHHRAVVRGALSYDALRGGALYLLWLAWQVLKPNGLSPFQVRGCRSTVRASCL